MKHITSLVAFVLSLSLALLVGCGGGDDDPLLPDGGNLPDEPDANLGPSDINPPLTPDDPCRQLKRVFDVPVLAADVATVGPHMFVYYTLTTGENGILIYENELLIEDVIAPGPFPILFYARDEVHALQSGQGRFNEVHVRTDGTLFDEMRGYLFQNGIDIAGARTTSDDLLIGTVTRDSIDQVVTNFFVNTGAVNFSFPPDSSASKAAIGWWSVRVGGDAVRAVTVGATNGLTAWIADINVLTRETTFAERAVAQMDYIEPVVLAMAMETVSGAMVASQRGLGAEAIISYERLDASAMPSSTLLYTSQAALMTRGAHAGDPAVGMDVYFVEYRLSEDQMSAAWHLVRPADGSTVAGRVGYASRDLSDVLGSLLVRDGVAMWAGPTIQDGNTPNYPADAIAVCQVTL